MVVPSLVDHRGEFISYDVTNRVHEKRRQRRSASDYQDDYHEPYSNKLGGSQQPEQSVYYSLSAYGMDFHFNLTLNTALLSPRYVLEYWSGSGNVWRRKGAARPCHYVGHLSSSRESRVALSNCFGLVSNLYQSWV